MSWRMAPSAYAPYEVYWEHLIRGERDLRNHIDCIHFNPVKHGLVARVVDWPHSSFHRFVREGVPPAEWSGESTDVRGRDPQGG